MTLTNLDYIELKKELEAKGLLNYTPVYYFFIFLTYVLVLAVCFWVIFYFNNWLATILISIPIAFVGMQFGYLGHDAGHRSISKNEFLNELIGHFSHSLFIGLSFNYWKFVHNQHHAEPNHPELDPDIKEDKPFSLTKLKVNQRKGLARVITRYQSYLLFPAFLLLMFTKRIKSLKHIMAGKKYTMMDIISITTHVLLFFTVIPYFIGFLKAITLYLIVSMQIGFYFGFAFIPNHVGMTILTGNEKISFIEKQVLTSRNIKSGWFLNLISGGLNYQIEHHLFPHISRKNLPKAKTIVKEFCARKNLPYKDSSLTEAWKDVFAYLDDIGKSARRFPIFKVADDMV